MEVMDRQQVILGQQIKKHLMLAHYKVRVQHKKVEKKVQ
jgi:hypothetical protein